jgi:hypothetical protein
VAGALDVTGALVDEETGGVASSVHPASRTVATARGSNPRAGRPKVVSTGALLPSTNGPC